MLDRRLRVGAGRPGGAVVLNPSQRDAFTWQANVCRHMGAPFSGAVISLVGSDDALADALGDLVSETDAGDARALLEGNYPVRVLAAFHYLVLTQADRGLMAAYDRRVDEGLAEALRAAVAAHPDVFRRYLASAPQTNEVKRSFCLVGGFLTLAAETGLPLRCLEIGASAGLNMNWDLYAYRFGDRARWGPTDRGLTLEGGFSGPLPPVDADCWVVDRAGCDINPLRADDPEDALRLQSFVWADQHERLERLRAALVLARTAGTVVERADAVAWTRDRLRPVTGVTSVLYHSIFFQYLGPDAAEALVAAIAAAGAAATPSAPVAWLRMEPAVGAAGAVELRMTLWPTGQDRRLAFTDPHGGSVSWTA